jgi:hypothetical protein
MRVVLINLTGNVGKTTLARHLFRPRMPGAPVIPVETVNTGDLSDGALPAEQFRRLTEFLATTDDAIVDVGASNAERFFVELARYRGAHEDVELFVVPTVPDPKPLRDTLATVAQLAGLGVEPGRIRVVVNRVQAERRLPDDIAALTAFAQATRQCVVDPEAFVRENELFAELQPGSETVADLVADSTDLRSAIRAATDPEAKQGLARRLASRRLAAGVEVELDRVFASLQRPST